MQKSPDAFRTISEVATDLDVPQHVLRFWETRFATIKPLKRGGGRRYYRPDDVELLRGIRELLYGKGYTIKGVQRILKQDGPRVVQAIGRGDGTIVLAPLRPDEQDEAPDPPPPPMEEPPPETDEPAASALVVRVNPGPLPASLRSGLAPADLDRLRAALDELRECRRVLDGLREPG